jgi:hypothetical protein
VLSKPKVKPTELKKVISLLEAEHPDVETLAHEVVSELKQRWFSEDYFVVLMYDPNARDVFPFGMYTTKNQAQKELEKLASAGPIPSKAWVAKVREVPE